MSIVFDEKKKDEKSKLSEKYINIGVYLGLMLLRRGAGYCREDRRRSDFFMQETNLRSEMMSEPGGEEEDENGCSCERLVRH